MSHDPDFTHKLLYNPFKKSSQPVKKELLPFQAESVASNQNSVPLPLVRGTRLMAVRWISPALNMITQPVPAGGKKG